MALAVSSVNSGQWQCSASGKITECHRGVQVKLYGTFLQQIDDVFGVRDKASAWAQNRVLRDLQSTGKMDVCPPTYGKV